MNVLVLSRSFKTLRIPLSTAIGARHYHAGKAATVVEKITKGFQKSKGLAFRGSTRKNENDPRPKFIERHGKALDRVGTSRDLKGRSNTREPKATRAQVDRRESRGEWPSKGGSKERDFKEGGSSKKEWEDDGALQTSRGRRIDGETRSPWPPRRIAEDRGSKGGVSSRREWQDSGPSHASKDKRNNGESGSKWPSKKSATDRDSQGVGSMRREWQDNGPSHTTRDQRMGKTSRQGAPAWPSKGDSRNRAPKDENSVSETWSTTPPPKRFMHGVGNKSEKKVQGVWPPKKESRDEKPDSKARRKVPKIIPANWPSRKSGRDVKDSAQSEFERKFASKVDSESRSADGFTSKKTREATNFPHPNQRHLESIGSKQRSDNGAYARFKPKPEDEHASESLPITHAKYGAPISVPYTTSASEFIYGTHAVEAAMVGAQRQLYKLYIQIRENREMETLAKDEQFERLARKRGVKCLRVGKEWNSTLNKMTKDGVHNGYILEASPLPKLPVTSLGSLKVDGDGQEGFEVTLDRQSKEEAEVNGTDNFVASRKNATRKPLVLLLNSIVDPQNLGGIIRSASFLGVSAIAVSKHSAPFSGSAMKAAAGAAEGISILRVNMPADFVSNSRNAGWKVYCAIAPPRPGENFHPKPLPVDEADDPLVDAPILLVLGSEGSGLPKSLLSKADEYVYIRGRGAFHGLDSLNVGVAAGVLCAAINRRGKVTRTSFI